MLQIIPHFFETQPMKLYYFNGRATEFKVGNFGDDLNPWLWNQLLPNVFDDNDRTLFVGIGTLINHRLPTTAQKLVFGSGVGYGNLPQIDHTWKPYFVRGKLSAQKLGLDIDMGLTDPAILVSKVWTGSEQKAFKWAYMPHYHEHIFNGLVWQEICESVGIHYISPTAPIEQVLSEISCAETLLAEAMHGAIIADALRVPWVAVRTKPDILEFKWSDWLSTVDIPYKPVNVRRFASRPGKKGLLRYCDYQLICLQMSYLKSTSQPLLSTLHRHQELEEKVTLKLEQFKSDLASGAFN
jgi:succinoglycan biosynthesis protein ExoV